MLRGVVQFAAQPAEFLRSVPLSPALTVPGPAGQGVGEGGGTGPSSVGEEGK